MNKPMVYAFMDFDIKTDVNADNDELYIIDDASTTVSTSWKKNNTYSVGSTSTEIKIQGIGTDSEKQKKIRKLAEKQLSKLDELKDNIINFISRNEMTRRETQEWKSDLDLIEGFERELKNALDKEDQQLMYSGAIKEEDVLDPSQLDTLNEIYKRWT